MVQTAKQPRIVSQHAARLLQGCVDEGKRPPEETAQLAASSDSPAKGDGMRPCVRIT